METLREQVSRAWRRLLWSQFLTRAGWCVFVALVLATLGMAVPRVIAIERLPAGWDNGCFLAGLFGGLIAAGAWTYVSHRSRLDAAIEIDRRFDLRERVASSLSLSEAEAASDAGRALVSDALRAVSRIEVDEQFRIRTGRSAWLPLVPMAIALLMVVLLDVRQADSSANPNPAAAEAEQVKRSADAARKEIAQRRKEAKELGLELTEGLFDRIEKRTDELAKKKDVSRTQAAVELNDLAKELEARQRQLGGRDGMARQFQSMKQLGAGPADKMAQALKNGAFQAAQQEVEKLQKQLQDGSLDKQSQQRLADQMEKMQQQIDAAAQAHQQAQASLQQQIDQLRSQGKLSEAGQLQQQLDQLQQQAPLMSQLQQFGMQLGQCKDGCRSGNSAQANQSLSQMAAQLSQMQQNASEMKLLDSALGELQQCKNSMACSQCKGGGCKECGGGGGGGKMAAGSKGSPSSNPGMSNEQGPQTSSGIGKGQGPDLLSGSKSESNAKQRDVQVQPKIGAGPGVFAGLVDGPSIKGQAVETIKQEMAAQAAEPADPQTIERLPRTRREQAEDYFELLRENE